MRHCPGTGIQLVWWIIWNCYQYRIYFGNLLLFNCAVALDYVLSGYYFYSWGTGFCCLLLLWRVHPCCGRLLNTLRILYISALVEGHFCHFTSSFLCIRAFGSDWMFEITVRLCLCVGIVLCAYYREFAQRNVVQKSHFPLQLGDNWELP